MLWGQGVGEGGLTGWGSRRLGSLRVEGKSCEEKHRMENEQY